MKRCGYASGQLTTHCARFDLGGRGFKVTVENSVVTRFEPDRNDPFSRGYRGNKSRAAVQRLRHPERLAQPLRHRGERGSGHWDEIGWDEALDQVAARL